MENNEKNLVSDLTAESFDKVALGTQLALVDFWAEWCGPCRTLGPIVETVAEMNRGELDVYKVNVDDHPELAQRFDIRGIPALLLFKDGQLVERIIGVQPAAVIQGIAKQHMNTGSGAELVSA